MKKIIIKFSGGFGNQLFQYAVAKNFEIQKGYKIVPDYNFFKNYKLHKNLIKKFNFRFNSISFFLSPVLIPYKLNFLYRFLSKLFFNINYIKENDNLDYKNLSKLKNKIIYLDGYWQDFRYFFNSANQIKKLINCFLRKNSKKIYRSRFSRSKNYVMLHCRLKDYKSKTNFLKHGLMSLNYYSKAINIINKKKKNNVFVIFSDEPSLAKKKFGHLKNKIFLDERNKLNTISSLYLMSKCNDFIISNSTFSWWAAYLSTSHNKNVICPMYWYRQKKFKKISYEKKWIKI